MSSEVEKDQKDVPDWLNLPWVYQKPSNESKLEEWFKMWGKFIRDISINEDRYFIYLNEIQKKEYFNKLSKEHLIDILDYAESMGDGKWLTSDKTNFYMLKHSFDKMADLLYKKMKNSPQGNKPIGLYQLESDDEFGNLPKKLHKQILQVLIKKGLARWWPGQENFYVELKGSLPFKKEKRPFFGKSRFETIGDCQVQIDGMRDQQKSIISEIDKLENEIDKLLDIKDEKSENRALDLARRVETLEQMRMGLENKIIGLDLTIQTLIGIEVDSALKPILNQTRQLQNEASKLVNEIESNVEAILEGRTELASLNSIFEMLALSPTISENKVEERLEKYKKYKIKKITPLEKEITKKEKIKEKEEKEKILV